MNDSGSIESVIWLERGLSQAAIYRQVQYLTPEQSKIVALADAVLRLQQPDEPSVWQPIETAPKDQALLIVDAHSIRFMGYWNSVHAGWFDNNGNERPATHWMDPSYPTAETKEENHIA